MASPLAVYKLTILYMLDRAGGEIPVPMISAFLLENGYTGFSSLVQTYSEMEENGLVNTRTEGEERTFLSITQEGEETLRFFVNDLSTEIRDQIRVFLKENGRQLRREQSLTADYYRNSFGNFEAHLAVREKNETVVDIRLTVPDAPTAVHITEAWREKNQEIYAFLIENLF
ncbi:MAG: DUF4364 family protein [Lachnospiraceae bacterium]|nr:DUF4364 family protein [Lachnospiraceae bacterium]MBQ9644401.1 DUF4364 family protein [Lachnospiraceae bacterium]